MALAAVLVRAAVILVSMLVVPACSGDVISDFDDGTLQGWVPVGDVEGVSNPGAGGNPGGYLRMEDQASGGTCWVVAPAQFLGNWHDKLVISADLIQFYGITHWSNAKFEISGPGGKFTRTFDKRPPSYWCTFQTRLDESLWSCNSGSWSALLDNVTSFRILMEFVSGEEANGLDNVVLIERGEPAAIGEARQLPDGSQVQVTGIVSRVMPDCFYMQAEDRSAGIRVEGQHSANEGDRLDVSGRLNTMHGERVLESALILSQSPGTPPKPLLIRCGEFGGSGKTAADPVLGEPSTLKETGLLVKAAGWVSECTTDGGFFLGDGSRVHGRCADGVAAPVPGSFAAITGISAGYGEPPRPVLLMAKDEYQPFSLSLGMNLIRNGGAEEGKSGTNGALVSPVCGWTCTSGFTVTDYGYIYPQLESQRIGGGRSFFFGGISTAQSEAVQYIDVSSLAELIDSGKITAALSGYLGGRDLERDYPTVTASYYSASGSYLGGVQIGGTGTTSNNVWNFYEKVAPVLAGTRRIRVKMMAVRIIGKNADGFFDNLSLVLTSSQ